jgi:hypothetical protein
MPNTLEGGAVSFEHRSTEDLIRVVKAGGALKLAATDRSTDDLVRIASAAADWGVSVPFSGLQDRSTDDLVVIADAGQGSVCLKG